MEIGTAKENENENNHGVPVCTVLNTTTLTTRSAKCPTPETRITEDVSLIRKPDNNPAGYPTVFEKFTSHRYRLCCMVTFGHFMMHSLVIIMAFALVCMTRGKHIPQQIQLMNFSRSGNNSDYTNISTDSLKEDAIAVDINEPEFSWNSATQGVILSATFYAGMVSPFVSSALTRRFGPKIVMFTSMFVSGLVTLLTPVLARTNLNLVIIARIVFGFFLKMYLPSTQDLWAHWAPVQEKAQLIGLTFAGISIASVVTFSVSGFLCTIPADNGWPFIFYVFGCLTMLWCLLWSLSAHDTPECHPTITEKEKRYIAENRRGINAGGKKPKVPWKSLLSSPAFWACVWSNFCHLWNGGLLYNFLPLYMSTVLDFDIKQNGLMSSVPYITRVVGDVTWATLSGFLIRHLSVTATRKTVHVSGNLGAAVLTLGIVFVPADFKAVAVVLFASLTFLQTASVTGAINTSLDFAPQFASVIGAFGGTASSLALLLMPLTTSFIIIDRTKEQWNIAFYLSSGVYTLSLLVFLIFGTGEIQSWAVNHSSDDDTTA